MGVRIRKTRLGALRQRTVTLYIHTICIAKCTPNIIITFPHLNFNRLCTFAKKNKINTRTEFYRLEQLSVQLSVMVMFRRLSHKKICKEYVVFFKFYYYFIRMYIRRSLRTRKFFNPKNKKV